MELCWETGGPEWLFGALLIAAAVAAAALVGWFWVWRTPQRVPQPVSFTATAITVAAAVAFGAAVTSVWTVLPFAVILLGASLASEAVRRHALTTEQGRALTGRWASIYRGVYVGTPVVFFIALLASAGLLYAMLTLGGECGA